MRRSDRLHYGCRVLLGSFVLLTALWIGLTADSFVITGHAESAGKVTANSAKIRTEPSTSSSTVGSALKDAALNVKGQITGSDGYIWYQVTDGSITGYIRSDLMTITDGSTPANLVSSTVSSTPTTSTPDETVVEVTEVEPVSAKVSGSSPVRVRQNASTTSRIVSTAQGGLALTVTGQAVGQDGKDWYQVRYTSGGSEISGFIRADYVSVSGELVPAGEAPEGTDPPQEPEAVEPEPVEEPKDWDTYFEGDKWHLVDNNANTSWEIDQIFASVEANKKTLDDMESKNKTQQVIVIILVILLILLATALSFVIFKLKDMTDSAYFNEVEKETMRRRNADRPVERNRNGQRTMSSPGTGGGRRPSGAGGQRPAGQRPSSAGGGQRPMNAGGSSQRPMNREGNGQRPVNGGGGGQRPMNREGNGQRPMNAEGSGQRPSGQRPMNAEGSGQRPSGQRPMNAGGNSQRPMNREGNGQRPMNREGNGQRPMNRQPAQGQPRQRQQDNDYAQEQDMEYMQESQAQESAQTQPREKPAGWKSKNFINNDEFEFQFLDWDEEQQ